MFRVIEKTQKLVEKDVWNGVWIRLKRHESGLSTQQDVESAIEKRFIVKKGIWNN